MLSPLKICLLIIAISYPLIIVSSILAYSLHSPNSIITYKTQSLGAAVNEYSWWIIGWLALGVIYYSMHFFTTNEINNTNTNDTNNNKYITLKYEKIIICITITIFYFQNLYILHR
jgi:hypothetical protein